MATRNWPPEAETIPVDEFGLPTLQRSEWRCWRVTLVRQFGPVEYAHVYAESRPAAQAMAIVMDDGPRILYTSAVPAALGCLDVSADAAEMQWEQRECDRAALRYVGWSVGGFALLAGVVLTGVYADDIVRVMAGWLS